LRDDDIEPVTRWAFDAAAELTATELARARATLHRSSWLMAKFQRDYDAIITPTLAQPPIPHGVLSLSREDAESLGRDHTAFSPFTPIANYTGQPAMSVPLHWTPDGLPVGVQFFGRFGDEATLFRLGNSKKHSHGLISAHRSEPFGEPGLIPAPIPASTGRPVALARAASEQPNQAVRLGSPLSRTRSHCEPAQHRFGTRVLSSLPCLRP
jgi:hypothetical protein